MKDGFIKVAAISPKVRVADCRANGEEIASCMEEAYRAGARIIVFPELCITGYTCQDLFLQKKLTDAGYDYNAVQKRVNELFR